MNFATCSATQGMRVCDTRHETELVRVHEAVCETMCE